MAGICIGSSRLLPKNFRTISISNLTRINYKNKSHWTRHYAAVSRAVSSVSVSKNKQNSLWIPKRIPEPSYFHTSRYLRDEVREVKVPQLAESLSEGDLRWDKGVGDQIAEDEVICQVETDKTAVPVHSPCAGVIEELLVEDGATVQPGMSICKIRVGGTASAKKPAPKEEAASETPKSEPPSSPSEADVSAPPPATPPPVPPKPSAPQSSKPVSSIKIPVIPTSLPPGQAESTIIGSRTEQRVKMNRMRQRIAQRLKEAQNVYAMLTTFNEIDMSNIIEMRNRHKDAFLKRHNIKLGFMSAFVKAAAYALQDQPVVNAVIEEGEIVYRDYIDISVAVATPKGLVVPVIRSLEKMNYADIEKAIHALGEKARTGALAIEDMDGGTFTISNGGVFGSLYGTPIINPPQSAILGMHAIVERPIAINGKVEIRPMMYVALTYDHRLIDGREAVLFLRKIKAAVEDPRIMLLDI
ncbi:dihydrolipoyllysine-residue succinyltransferase component of 2-oxoglutarate dehydrogenase complex, mitochondrial [Caerostris darwini]|uniref:Dihydrolipoyllysine-residue succinyltransferase component of 2-oxoglutarate dehydrogenase complex, mitochondrial n=1 Tax=Caerostris darwini TaxID=1538125 RepID=A0AAV4R2A8_9ARAC|nr:dihydrolipoyllysine-residue succinyltransferase component of 2-oxoglutarate dehydrogenase complex, mitochondrial [Caerostris darwini]